jgi:hypothetical protein
MSELVSPASIASWPEPGAEMPASSTYLSIPKPLPKFIKIVNFGELHPLVRLRVSRIRQKHSHFRSEILRKIQHAGFQKINPCHLQRYEN